MTTAREREELLMKKKVILERVLAKLKELILINSDKGPFIYDVRTEGGYARGTHRMGGCVDITLYWYKVLYTNLSVPNSEIGVIKLWMSFMNGP